MFLVKVSISLDTTDSGENGDDSGLTNFEADETTSFVGDIILIHLDNTLEND